MGQIVRTRDQLVHQQCKQMFEMYGIDEIDESVEMFVVGGVFMFGVVVLYLSYIFAYPNHQISFVFQISTN